MKIHGDLIQMGILIISGLSMLGGYWAYCESHFATKDSVMTEREERRELKAEVDAMYVRFVPAKERLQLKHPGVGE